MSPNRGTLPPAPPATPILEPMCEESPGGRLVQRLLARVAVDSKSTSPPVGAPDLPGLLEASKERSGGPRPVLLSTGVTDGIPGLAFPPAGSRGPGTLPTPEGDGELMCPSSLAGGTAKTLFCAPPWGGSRELAPSLGPPGGKGPIVVLLPAEDVEEICPSILAGGTPKNLFLVLPWGGSRELAPLLTPPGDTGPTTTPPPAGDGKLSSLTPAGVGGKNLFLVLPNGGFSEPDSSSPPAGSKGPTTIPRPAEDRGLEAASTLTGVTGTSFFSALPGRGRRKSGCLASEGEKEVTTVSAFAGITGTNLCLGLPWGRTRELDTSPPPAGGRAFTPPSAPAGITR